MEGYDAFGFSGTILSLLASGIMSWLLLGDSEARTQVRPRMLMYLAVTDFLYSLTSIIWSINIYANRGISLGDTPLWPASQQGLNFAYQFFGNASWMWTAMISEHIVYVVRTDVLPNSEAEVRRERLYHIAQFLAMVFVFTPCSVYTYWGKDQWFRKGHHVGGVGIFQFVFLLVIMLWILGCVCRVMVLRMQQSQTSRSPASKLMTDKYVRQMQRFLFAFVTLTVGQLLYVVHVLVLGETASVALRWILRTQFFLPFFNAILWGLSRSCLETCITKVTRADSLTGSSLSFGFNSDLGLPLLAAAEIAEVTG